MDPIVGLWKRLTLEEPTGTEIDRTSSVYWLQTHHLFGDIRIPKDRPKRKNMSEYTDEEIDGLLLQKGFAGFTTLSADYVCRWNRDIDFQLQEGIYSS